MESSPTKRVAANVRRLRSERGWSLAELSKRVSKTGHRLSLRVLSNIETGARGVDVDDLVALAGVFGERPEALLTDPAVTARAKAINDVDRLLDMLGQARQQRAVTASAIEHADAHIAEIEDTIRDLVSGSNDREIVAALRAMLEVRMPGKEREVSGLFRRLTKKEGR